MSEGMEERLGKKTGEQRLVEVCHQEYQMPVRLAEALVLDAIECLVGKGKELGIGQIRVNLARQHQGAGRQISQMRLVEVVWTINAGREDAEVKKQHGGGVLRQLREQRLLDEAIEQGAVATQEDLAWALHTSIRTIKRDFAAMSASGQWLPSRGMLQGMGRGQSHKGQIIARWLRGESYDQLRLSTRHAVVSIQRYIRAFVRVVELHERGNPVEAIAFLLQMGAPLVDDYLAVYQLNDSPGCRERLHDQLARLNQVAAGKKGAL